MSFRDREQCDRAVAHIYSKEEPAESIHNAVFTMIKDQVSSAGKTSDPRVHRGDTHLQRDTHPSLPT